MKMVYLAPARRSAMALGQKRLCAGRSSEEMPVRIEKDVRSSVGTGLRGLALGLACALCVVLLPAGNANAQSAAQCDRYARDYSYHGPTGQIAGGAARGALGGAAIGAIAGGGKGARRGAAWGAGIGAVAGGARRAADRERSYRAIYDDCMRGRGYHY